MIKKAVALVISLALTASLAACGSTTTKKDATTTTGAAKTEQTATTAPKQKVKISIMMHEFPNAPVTSEQITLKTLSQKLNIELDLQQFPAKDYDQKLNLLLSSGELPDTLQAGGFSLSKYYPTGVFLQLDQLLKTKAPNVIKQIESHGLTKSVLSDDGHFYFVPYIAENAKMETNGWINKEWMTLAGITKVPTTTDELYQTLKAFKEKMPKDTIPMTKGPWYTLEAGFYRAFATDNTWVMYDSNLGLEYGPYQRSAQLKDALKYMNKLYTEGLIDNQYLTRDDDTINALSAKNQSGYYQTWSDHAQAIAKGGTQGRDFVPVPPLKGPSGKAYQKTNGGIIQRQFVVSAKSKSVDRIMEMYNYIFSDEGTTLFNWGVDGDTYKVESGAKKFTDKVIKHEKGALTGGRIFGLNYTYFPHLATWESWMGVLLPITVDAVKAQEPYLMPFPAILTGTEQEETELAKIMTDISKYVSQTLPQFIIGKTSIDQEFDAFVAQLKKMNIERAIEIQKAKYDRFTKRASK